MINKYVDKIYYINLEHRTDRKEHIEKQIKEYLDPSLKITERFNAIVYTNNVAGTYRNKGGIGCSLSNLQIIKNAKKEGYKAILILEDDIIFNFDKDRFNNLLDIFYKNITDYNLLVFDTGGYDACMWKNHPTHIPDIYKLSGSCCAGAYIIPENFYSTYIEHLKLNIPKLIAGYNECRQDESWKMFQGNEEDKKVYTFNKPGDKVLYQMGGYSDIEGRVCNPKNTYPEC